MKKIFTFLCIALLFLSFSTVWAIDNESNSKKVGLIEDYISKHKLNIEELIDKYQITNNPIIDENVLILNQSLEAVQKLKQETYDDNKVENVLQDIIKRVKQVNSSLKEELKYERRKFEIKLAQKQEVYNTLWKKLSSKIYDINLRVAKKIFKNKTVLSLKESNIKLHLINLNQESIKLKNFWQINFRSQKEMRDAFASILANIKTEVNLMKKELK